MHVRRLQPREHAVHHQVAEEAQFLSGGLGDGGGGVLAEALGCVERNLYTIGLHIVLPLTKRLYCPSSAQDTAIVWATAVRKKG